MVPASWLGDAKMVEGGRRKGELKWQGGLGVVGSVGVRGTA